MRVALIEDEVPALAHLERLLLRVRPGAEVVARLRTVREITAWLRLGAPCELIIADVQLGDGVSLDALRESASAIPVIFVTAFDHYARPALTAAGIAYVVKPLSEATLAAGLDKHDALRRHYLAGLADLARTLGSASPELRIVGRRGLDWVGVQVTNVRWVRVRNGIVVAHTDDGSELMLDESLVALQAQLSPRFFRANRWMLVSLPAVRRVRPAGRGRLELILDPVPDASVVVPQESAAAFKAWFGVR